MGTVFGKNKAKTSKSQVLTVTNTSVFAAAVAARQQSNDLIPATDFAPAIPLTPSMELKSGEEDEDVVTEVRAKVYRFDTDANEWKERGVGKLKLLQHKEDRSLVRVLMRREKVMHLAINHRVTSDLKPMYHQNNPKNLSWSAVDHSMGEPRPERFTIRIGSEDMAAEFKLRLEELVEVVKVGRSDHCTSANGEAATSSEAIGPPNAVMNIIPSQQLKSMSEAFQRTEGSWECGSHDSDVKSASSKVTKSALSAIETPALSFSFGSTLEPTKTYNRIPDPWDIFDATEYAELSSIL